MLDTKESISQNGRLWMSDMVLIIACYLILDLLVRGGFSLFERQQSGQFAFDVPHRSRIWYACRDFLQHKSTPDVVLLGASDMTCALYTAEATYLHSNQNQLLKHKSDYLNDKMAELGCPFKSNFCLGIPGEMISDAYFIVKTMLVPKGMPKAIVLSLCPRDLFDATFGNLSDTDIYKLMSKMGGTRDLELSYRKSIWDKLGYVIAQSLSVYDHKWEFATWQHQALQSVVTACFGIRFDDAKTCLHVRRIALHELPEDFGPNEVQQSPYDPSHPLFLNNVAEYQSRYSKFRKSLYDQQLDFLRKISEICQTNGVRLTVINSPITAENRAMIPPALYDRYVSETRSVVHQFGGAYVDLNTPGLFQHNEFSDSAHLNGLGGLKFFEHIATALSETSSVASSGKSSSQ